MASFKKYTSRSVTSGAAATQIGGLTVTAPTASVTAIGFSIANTSGVALAINAYVKETANANAITYLAYNMLVPVGGTLVLVGADQKLNLLPGDQLFVIVTSTGGGTADVILSTMEQ